MITPKDNLNLTSKKETIDKRAQSHKKQGKSTEENCRNDILQILLGSELRYRQLMCRLVESEFILENARIEKENVKRKAENQKIEPLLEKPKRFYSKQTVTHYLSDLFKEEKVTRNIPENKLSSKKPPLFLTDKGREEARKQGLINSLRELPYPTIEEIIFAYKREIIDNLIKLSNEPAKPYRHPILPALRKNGVKYHIEMRGGPFSIPSYELSSKEKLAFSKMNTFVRHRAEYRKSIEAIEGVLRGYDFSEQEIITMWLRNGSAIAKVLRFRSEKSEPTKEAVEELKRKTRENLIFQENLSNGILSNVKHLFP